MVTYESSQRKTFAKEDDIQIIQLKYFHNYHNASKSFKINILTCRIMKSQLYISSKAAVYLKIYYYYYYYY